MRIQCWIDMPMVEVGLDEIWIDGDAPEEVTESAVKQQMADVLHEFFFLSEGDLQVNIVRDKGAKP